MVARLLVPTASQKPVDTLDPAVYQDKRWAPTHES